MKPASNQNGFALSYSRTSYKVNIEEELKKRKMLFGVIIALLAAVLCPRLGAPGGVLRTEYSRYIPLSYIYMSAGFHCDVACLTRPWRHFRFLGCVQWHVYVTTPLLVAGLVRVFQALGTDDRILKGALVSSCGSSNSWLGMGVRGAGADSTRAVLAAAVGSLLSVLVTPVSLLLVCGSTSVMPAAAYACSCLLPAALVPLGVMLQGRVSSSLCRQPLVRAAVLLLLYVECCTELLKAEGQLAVLDVLLTFGLVCSWFSLSVAVCHVAASCVCPQHRSLAVLCSVHKSFEVGWHIVIPCPTTGLSRLPAVLAAPAQVAILAAVFSEAGDPALPRPAPHPADALPLISHH